MTQLNKKAQSKRQAAPQATVSEVPVGRPKGSYSEKVAKKLDTLERHLRKRGGEFTPTDVTKSLALQLRDVNNPRMRVKQWMEILTEQGKLKHVGFKHSGGKPAKLFALTDQE